MVSPRTVLLALLTLLVLAPRLPAEMTWSAQVGLGGTTVPGTWAPLRVESSRAEAPWTLTVTGVTEGSPDIPVGSFVLPGNGVFERPVFLPDGLDFLVLNRAEGGLVREEKRLPVGTSGFPGHLIVVDGVGPGVQRTLSDLLLPLEPIRVVAVPPSGWPLTFQAWGSVAALVVRDPGPVLSPGQRGALVAWVASGGRLAVLDRREASLLDQIGPTAGRGRAGPSTEATLAADLDLGPYGTAPRLGTDFDPPPPPPSLAQGPVLVSALVLLGIWATVLGALARWKKGSFGSVLAVTFLGSVAVLVLGATGGLGWDRGVEVLGRRVILPGQAGAVTTVEALLPGDRIRAEDWPLASPWGLERWKEAQAPEGLYRVQSPGRYVLESFGPAPSTASPYQVRWTGKALSWTKDAQPLETAPDAFRRDLAWLARVAATLPGRTWTVGLETSSAGSTCWIRPVDLGVRS